jgi:hypothetical protein
MMAMFMSSSIVLVVSFFFADPLCIQRFCYINFRIIHQWIALFTGLHVQSAIREHLPKYSGPPP